MSNITRIKNTEIVEKNVCVFFGTLEFYGFFGNLWNLLELLDMFM